MGNKTSILRSIVALLFQLFCLLIDYILLGVEKLSDGLLYILAKSFTFLGLIPKEKDIHTDLGKMLTIGLTFIALLFMLVANNLKLIFGTDGARYRTIGVALHRPKEVIIPATRGRILASDGRPIAITSTEEDLAFHFGNKAIDILYKDPNKILKEEEKEKQKIIRDSIYRGFDQLSILLEKMYSSSRYPVSAKLLKDRWIKGLKGRKYVRLLSKSITYIDRMKLESHPPLAPQPVYSKSGKFLYTKPSLMQQLLAKPTPQDRRLYPFGSLARRSIGLTQMDMSYVNPDLKVREDVMMGTTGLESYYNDTLRGRSGIGLEKYSANMKIVNVRRPAEQGADIHTSLDMNKQSIVTQITSSYLEQFGAERGSVILMEVATGRIVAITNLSRQKDGSYNESENIAMTDRSEPGSTFKTASMMVALDEGYVLPSDTIDTGNGTWVVGKRTLRDHNAHRGGYGRISASQVLEYSSNVGIAKIITKAYSNNPDHFIDRLRAIGFTKPLQIDLNNVSIGEIKKRSENPNKWYGTSLAWISHGYETKIPPIYTLAFYNAIANGGKMMAPHFATKISHQDGRVEEIRPIVLRESICKEETAKQLQDMLRRVVTHGTGKRLKNDVVSISGKSGTAKLLMTIETKDPETGNIRRTYSYVGADGRAHYQLSFCAFFPSEKPKYSCIAVVRNPSIPNPGGGSTAGPIIRDIAIALTALEAPRDLSHLTPTIASAKSVFVPSGLKEQIISALVRAGLQPKDGKINSNTKYVSVDNSKCLHELKDVHSGIMPNLVGMSATDATYLLLSLGYVPECDGFGNVVTQSIPMGVSVALGTKVKLQLGIN